jgi:hypothetical protein
MTRPPPSAPEQDPDDPTQTTSAAPGNRPGGTDAGQSARTWGAFRLPLLRIGDIDPLRLLWLGGLAAMATIEVIEWPVALALGAASVVAERLARQEMRKDLTVLVARSSPERPA